MEKNLGAFGAKIFLSRGGLQKKGLFVWEVNISNIRHAHSKRIEYHPYSNIREYSNIRRHP